jgi:hypothetical protein
VGVAAGPEVIDRLLARYRAEGRELRACQPRDLIERSNDICRFRGIPLELTPEVLDVAWFGYFGIELPGSPASGNGGTEGRGSPG